jgi:hypothetical protein
MPLSECSARSGQPAPGARPFRMNSIVHERPGGRVERSQAPATAGAAMRPRS